jgi:hypothetical protein
MAGGPAAQAQICRGMPTSGAWALGGLTDNGAITGALGLGRMKGIAGNVQHRDYQQAGLSRNASDSWGVRLFASLSHDEGRSAMCFITGAQFSYGHVINAEGLNYNVRITDRTLPLGFGFGVSGPLGRAGKVFAFAIPVANLVSRELILYDRTDTSETITESPFVFLFEAGGGVVFGPLVLRASIVRARSETLLRHDRRTTWGWTLGAGLTTP